MTGPAPDVTVPGTVGFIGLGNIGGPMARRLLRRVERLVVFDVVADAMAPFVTRGAIGAADPAAVAAEASVVCVMVRDEAQVWDVMDGVLTTAAPGTVVAVHSTIGADAAVQLAARAAEVGVEVVDAPVSGGAIGAHDGTLAVMAGGSVEAVERCRATFECFATLVAHLGPTGAGVHAKIARNLITFASFAAVGEAQRLAEAAGVDLGLLGEVVRHSDRVTGGAGAVMLRPNAATLAPDDGLRAVFEHTATLGGKDLALAEELGAATGVDTPMAALAGELLRSALGLDDPRPRQ